MNFLPRFRDAAIVAVLVAVPFFFLNSNLKQPENLNWLDRLLLQVSGPVQYVATVAARSVSGVVEEYAWLVDTQREKEVLERENDRLRDELRSLVAVSRENRRLLRLLGLRETLRGPSLTARVIARVTAPSSFYVTRIRVDRGDRDLVSAGMPVVNSDGLVGEVLRTGGRFGDVRLTIDPDSKIDVVIRRTGARGMLRGVADSLRYACQIEYLERESVVAVGDEVHTSGLGTKYPEGILVGWVARVVHAETGLYQEVEVKPSVNFSTIDEVLILTSGSREQVTGRGRSGP